MASTDASIWRCTARYYDPKIGRFIGEDPIGFQGGINFYAYVWNNPVNWKDPSGLRVQVCTRQAGGSLALFNHTYLWNPDTKENCGRGPRSGNESGPGPGNTCFDIPGSEGREKELMNCCRATAQSDSFVPGIHTVPFYNDCHDITQNCVTKSGLTYPNVPGGRMGERCDPCSNFRENPPHLP